MAKRFIFGRNWKQSKTRFVEYLGAGRSYLGEAEGIWGIVTVVINMVKDFGLLRVGKTTRGCGCDDLCLGFDERGMDGTALEGGGSLSSISPSLFSKSFILHVDLNSDFEFFPL